MFSVLPPMSILPIAHRSTNILRRGLQTQKLSLQPVCQGHPLDLPTDGSMSLLQLLLGLGVRNSPVFSSSELPSPIPHLPSLPTGHNLFPALLQRWETTTLAHRPSYYPDLLLLSHILYRVIKKMSFIS